MEELDLLICEGALSAPHIYAVRDIIEMDIHEDEMAQRLREYMHENVTSIELAAVTSDMLQALHIISKYFFRRLYEWRGCTSERH